MERRLPQINAKGTAGAILFGRERIEEEPIGADQTDSLLLSSTDREDPQKLHVSRSKVRVEHQTTRSTSRNYLERKLDDAVGMIEQLRNQMSLFERFHRQEMKTNQQLHNAMVQVKLLQKENKQLKGTGSTKSDHQESMERLRKEIDVNRQLTERSQNGLVGELEQYHKVLQQTTKNLSDVLQAEVHELKTAMEGQERRIAELTKENTELRMEVGVAQALVSEPTKTLGLAQQTHRESELHVVSLTKENANLKAELAAHSKQTERIAEELRKTQEALLNDPQSQQLDQANIQIRLLREQLCSTTLELDNCKRTIVELDEQVLELKEDLLELNRTFTQSTNSTRLVCCDSEYRDHDHSYLLHARRKLAQLRDQEFNRLGSLVQSLRCCTHYH